MLAVPLASALAAVAQALGMQAPGQDQPLRVAMIAKRGQKHRYWNVRGFWEWHSGLRSYCSICLCDPNRGHKPRKPVPDADRYS